MKTYNYSIHGNFHGIKSALLRKVMSKVVNKLTGIESNVSEIMQEALQVGIDSLKYAAESTKNDNLKIVLESLDDTIETMVVNYAYDKNGDYPISLEGEDPEIPEDGSKDNDIAADIMNNQDGEGFSDVVSEIIETAIDGTREQMKAAVKLALKVEKDKQEEKYNQEKEDADEFGELTPGMDDEEKDDKESDDKEDSKDEDKKDKEKEGSDPFADDNEDKSDDKEDQKEDSSDDSNPFDEPEEKSEESKEESNDKEDKEDKDATAAPENPFESIVAEVNKEAQVSLESIVMNKLGVEPGVIHGFVNHIANMFMSDEIRSTYESYGAMSDEMTKVKAKYQHNAKRLFDGLVNTAIVLESLGMPFDNKYIKYPELLTI